VSAFALEKLRLVGGVWEGWLSAPGGSAPAPPEIEATHRDAPLPGVEVRAEEGGWRVRVPVPAAILADGVQTVLIRDRAAGETLASFSILAGEAVEDDIRAEIELLRAELDMLKRAFRRHCLETM
jgi:hypothetical protein